MRKLQNTLYITTQGSYLHKERETLVVELERQKVAQLPVHSIGHIFCFGNVLVSPFLLGFCGENNVNLAFFTEPPSGGCVLKQNLINLNSIIFSAQLLYLSTQFIPNNILSCISPLFALDYAPFLAFMIYNYACF